MSDDKIMTLKEMCDLFDVTPRTLRYYEYIELLEPIKDGRTRYYGSRERARMKIILRGRRFGFGLEEVRQWLELYSEDDGTRKQMEVWLKRSTEQIDELEERRAELAEAIEDLKQMRKWAEDGLGKRAPGS